LYLGGDRAFPPQGLGRTPGYDLLPEALSDLKHPEREEHRTWAGEHYHPEHFNLEETSERLRGMK